MKNNRIKRAIKFFSNSEDKLIIATVVGFVVGIICLVVIAMIDLVRGLGC